jgi:hypothetical protein
MPKQRERCLNAVQKSKNYCGGNYLSVTVISNMKCHGKCILLLLLLFGQVDQQDVPMTGQPSKRQSKKKRNKTIKTTKQSLRISRTIPTHIIASYCIREG